MKPEDEKDHWGEVVCVCRNYPFPCAFGAVVFLYLFISFLDLNAEDEMKDLFFGTGSPTASGITTSFHQCGLPSKALFFRLADPDRSDCYIPLPDITWLRS